MAKISHKKSLPLADYIRPALETKYSTQLEASVDIGIGQSLLSHLLTRKFPSVSEEIVIKICKKLGLSSKEGIRRLQQARELKAKQFLSKP